MTPRELLARYTSAGQISSFFTDQMGIYSAKAYGAKGDGVTDDYTAINNMVTAVTTAGKGIIFFPSGTYVIGTSLTLPEASDLWFADGAILSPNNGVTVTLNGSIDASPHRIFSGAGTIAIGRKRNTRGYAEWWGAAADGVTDNSTPFSSAFAALSEVRLQSGLYVCTTAITIKNAPRIVGNSSDSLDVTGVTQIEFDNAPAVMLNITAGGGAKNDGLIRDVFFTGINTATGCINIDNMAGWEIEHCRFSGINGTAILVQDGSYYNTIRNCRFVACQTAVKVTGGTQGPSNNTRIEDCSIQASTLTSTLEGVNFDNCGSCAAVNTTFEGIGTLTTHAAYRDAGTNNMLLNPYFDVPPGDCILLTSNAIGSTIIGVQQDGTLGGKILNITNGAQTTIVTDQHGNQYNIQPVTTLNGTTAGFAYWQQDRRGEYKRVLMALSGYENTTGAAQTITYPVPFTIAEQITSQPSGFGATTTTTTLTLPVSMGAPVTGVIVVEGI